jgi:hypothetical protein
MLRRAKGRTATDFEFSRCPHWIGGLLWGSAMALQFGLARAVAAWARCELHARGSLGSTKL